MHQYKTVAQILLILSVFNLVFAIPVEREIYNARGDAVVPVVLRGVATTSKEPRSDLDDLPSQSSSPPLAPSQSSPLLPDGLPSDGPASSHEIELASPGETASSSVVPALDHWHPGSTSTSQHPSAPPLLPDGLPSDGPASSHEIELVPALDHSDSDSTSTSEHSLGHFIVEPDPPPPETSMSRFAGKAMTAIDVTIVASIIAGGVYWLSHLNPHRQTTRACPDCSTAKESRHSCLD